MKLFAAFLSCLMFSSYASSQSLVSEAGMEISWSFTTDSIEIMIKSPSKGWMAVGFNERAGLQNTYLLMCRISATGAEVNEHFVRKPGDYLSITALGAEQRATIINASGENESSYIKFAIPKIPDCIYQKSLLPGSKFYVTYAYSESDDFQHHSIFRNTISRSL